MGEAGDELSIRGGVDLVAGDEVVTVKSITKVDGPTRVYNLEVASLDGQITHNYFVGEDEIWTHNISNETKGKLFASVCALISFCGDFATDAKPDLTDIAKCSTEKVRVIRETGKKGNGKRKRKPPPRSLPL